MSTRDDRAPVTPIRGVRVRVGGLVFAGERVLVVEHEQDGTRWHCFPGGALELGESPEEGLRRELREELDLACEVGPLVAVGYLLDETTHAVELYFTCLAAAQELIPRCPTVVSAQFIERTRLRALKVFPLEVAETLAASGSSELSSVRYYGRFA